MAKIIGSNKLVSDFICPQCAKSVTCGIGFRAGDVANIQYKLGDKVTWNNALTWPEKRPLDGTFSTIGYFECENLHCTSWQDCFPQVQEVLIYIENDCLIKAVPCRYKPEQLDYTVLRVDDDMGVFT
ncbi:MAG: hypothetical protein K2W82_17685 [Candidatus Obscuribacterales bacterium]|nr:hypothetical protein [Candidatus Obscuribacterales bacterium]